METDLFLFKLLICVSRVYGLLNFIFKQRRPFWTILLKKSSSFNINELWTIDIWRGPEVVIVRLHFSPRVKKFPVRVCLL